VRPCRHSDVNRLSTPAGGEGAGGRGHRAGGEGEGGDGGGVGRGAGGEKLVQRATALSTSALDPGFPLLVSLLDIWTLAPETCVDFGRTKIPQDVSAAVREQAEQAAARQQAAAEERLRAAREGQKVRRQLRALNPNHMEPQVTLSKAQECIALLSVGFCIHTNIHDDVRLLPQ
jgi:hypothetical protein